MSLNYWFWAGYYSKTFGLKKTYFIWSTEPY